MDTTPAVIFLIWSIIVSVSDTFLKPLFLGRGVDVPMLAILLGAIGGMMLSGILGPTLGHRVRHQIGGEYGVLLGRVRRSGSEMEPVRCILRRSP